MRFSRGDFDLSGIKYGAQAEGGEIEIRCEREQRTWSRKSIYWDREISHNMPQNRGRSAMPQYKRRYIFRERIRLNAQSRFS